MTPTNPIWHTNLIDPVASDHLVYTYQDEHLLAEAVSLFLGTGLKRNEGLIVISTQRHWDLFSKRLETAGFDPTGALKTGQLMVLNAEDVLAQFLGDGATNWKGFFDRLAEVISEVERRYPSVRAYGEMVDILWKRGQQDDAILLENLWNDLTKVRSFSLFCAYEMDHLNKEIYNGALQKICGMHSHFIPVRDSSRYETTVNQAGQEVLGPSIFNMVKALSSKGDLDTQMPNAQAVLLWLGENMGTTLDKVLAKTRLYHG